MDRDPNRGARSGSIQLLLYSIFHVGNATTNVSWDTYQKFAAMEPVAWTVPLSLGDSYAGFNLLVGDRRSLAYLSNRGGGLRELEPGIYGLSNATLDTPWDKVIRSKAALADLIERNTVDETLLLDILSNQSRSPETEAESDHLPPATAYALTAPFVTLPDYGTRCSSVVIQTKSGETRFLERRFDAGGTVSGESSYAFSV